MKTYEKPKLIKYGTLAALVKTSTGGAYDGNCTRGNSGSGGGQ